MAPTATITTSEDLSHLASRLRLVLARLGRRLRQETSEGLSPSMLAALSTLERSPRLTPGDHVGIVSPSWGGAARFPHRVANGVRQLESLGFKVKIGPHALNQSGHVSDSAVNRAHRT